jgi:N-acetylglucosaminyldiphosphoundecaprenol N-acetyl-beta-D-mannosaminyltransferase
MAGTLRTDVLGVETAASTLEAATSDLVGQAVGDGGGYVCLCNVHVLMAARREPDVARALSAARTVYADGAPVAWLQRRGGLAAERVAGPDLLESVVSAGREVGLRHVLFGSTEPVLERVAATLEQRYPGADIAALLAPPVASFDLLGGPWLERIRAHKPDVVWCSLGAPKQELWMHRFAAELAPAVVVGVGAAFDFVAGAKRRAPEWMQRCGIEWFHRLASEPGRLGPRYVTTNTQFVVQVVAARLRGESHV